MATKKKTTRTTRVDPESGPRRASPEAIGEAQDRIEELVMKIYDLGKEAEVTARFDPDACLMTIDEMEKVVKKLRRAALKFKEL